MKIHPLSFSKHKQQGLVLLASLMLIAIAALFGIHMAKNSRNHQEIAAANVRYAIVQQAAKLSLKRTQQFLKALKKPVAISDNPLKGRDFASNFDIDTLMTAQLSGNNTVPAFIWQRNALEDKVCGSNQCRSGIYFEDYLENNEDIWQDYAIISHFDQDIDKQNYLANTYTYTFIQSLNPEPTDPTTPQYYLITVLAVGYPPETPTSIENARERYLTQKIVSKKIIK